MKSKKFKNFQGKSNSGEKQSFELRFYSGYKQGETPRAVVIGNREFKIDEILWRKRVFDKEKKETSEIFKCKMEGDTVKITVCKSGEWAISFFEES